MIRISVSQWVYFYIWKSQSTICIIPPGLVTRITSLTAYSCWPFMFFFKSKNKEPHMNKVKCVIFIWKPLCYVPIVKNELLQWELFVYFIDNITTMISVVGIFGYHALQSMNKYIYAHELPLTITHAPEPQPTSRMKIPFWKSKVFLTLGKMFLRKR